MINPDPRHIECDYCHELVAVRNLSSHRAICEGLNFLRLSITPDSIEVQAFTGLIAQAAQRRDAQEGRPS